MKNRISLVLILMILLAPLSVFAADLTIDMQLNLQAADDANNYLTFTGANNSVEKDGYDAATGASKHLSTELFNSYRRDIQGKTTMPAGVRNFLLYAVAGNDTRVGDNLTVTYAGGVFTIRSVHRGTAYELVSDRNGRLDLSAPNYRTRKIGDTSNNIHADFSSNGRTTGVDWNKVWNASIAGGKTIGNTTTGNITPDVPASTFFVMSGYLQISGNNRILKLNGELNAVNK